MDAATETAKARKKMKINYGGSEDEEEEGEDDKEEEVRFCLNKYLKKYEVRQ